MHFCDLGRFAIGQCHIGGKQGEVLALLAFLADGIFRALGREIACRAGTGEGLRILAAAGEHTNLLRQRVLRQNLLALQLLNAILQFNDLAFVDFERSLDRGWRRNGARWRGRLLSSCEPHDDNHEESEAGEQPGLYVLGQETRRLGRLVLDGGWRSHGSSLYFSGTWRLKFSFFLPT